VTIVFLHGVPETAAIWKKVRAAIAPRESVALSLPGFGCERPAGFSATKDAYVDWALGEIDRIGEPVDLVGHDWGAGITYGIATRHGDRVRSWAADVGHIAHPDYVWHDFAKTWQTPGDGEAFFAAQASSTPAERAPLYQALGVPAQDALEMAEASDETMGQCILDLYRSAVPNPHADWGPWSPTTAPGLILHPTDDPFDDRAKAEEVATMLGARFDTIEGASHFWPYSAPDGAAAALTRFWDSL
jgi:pimeloyl-ACP methyl ester carboxylesterase